MNLCLVGDKAHYRRPEFNNESKNNKPKLVSAAERGDKKRSQRSKTKMVKMLKTKLAEKTNSAETL